MTAAKIFDVDQPKPCGDWVGWRAWFDLAGPQHCATEVAKFASRTQSARDPGTASFERERGNAFDKNAIAVYGLIGADRWRLGYVPRQDASEIARFAPDMPLAGRIIRVRFVADSVYVVAQMFVPSKKARTANGW